MYSSFRSSACTHLVDNGKWSPVPPQHHSPHPVLHKEESARPTISLPSSSPPPPFVSQLGARRRRAAEGGDYDGAPPRARPGGGHREGHVTEAAAEIDYNVDHENWIVVLWLGSADRASSCLHSASIELGWELRPSNRVLVQNVCPVLCSTEVRELGRKEGRKT